MDENYLNQFFEIGDSKTIRNGPAELEKNRYGKADSPENMKYGAPRKYRNGNQLGWDFTTNDGKLLRLKGGARVVGGYQTEAGYKSIVQTPNGEKYSFFQ